MSEATRDSVGTQQHPTEVPRRADGVVLLGEMAGSGYRVPPALVRRADGQTVQLTPLLYAVLEAVDGQRTAEEVAEAISASSGRAVSADNVAALLDKLRPLGLLDTPGAGDAPDRSDPLLALRFKVAISDPERTRRLTQPFARLFNPLVAVPVLAGFAWICWWVLFSKGLASSTHEAFARPGLLLVVLAVTVLSAGFHEFGHAAAARRGGATPGVMGAGLYLIWPAFYTDVTDSYRLGRGGRLRTDLGGLYFNAIVAVITVLVWWVSGYDAILLLVATQILQMVRQLLPLVRFDGYHVLADLTGVPDLFQRIVPTLKSLLPGHWRDPEVQVLKPWARAVITLWVLTVVPVFAAVLVLLALTLPRIVGTALAAAQAQREAMLAADDLVEALARGLSMVVVLLPVLAIVYLLVRLVRRVGGSVRQRTAGRPVRRGIAVITAAALVAGLAWVWWPSEDRYRPVQAYERGTLSDAVQLARPSTGFNVGSQGRGTIALPVGADLPTRDDPQLATVLVPTTQGASSGTRDPLLGGTDGANSADVSSDPGPGIEEGDVAAATPDTWVFPFDEPLAPDEGDTQALAVNTTDGTTTYDVAFALIWADGDEPVDTANEAYALASCAECNAVAIAFQVVLVVGDAVNVAPQNIAVSATYDCTSCLTFSLAVQLFVTLDGPLTEAAMAELEELWTEILAYGEGIGQVPLDQIQDALNEFQAEILSIIEADQGPLTEPSASPTATPTASPTASPTGDATPTAPASTPTDPGASESPDVASGSPTATATSAQPSTSGSPTSSPSGQPSPTQGSSSQGTSSPSPSGSSSGASSATPSGSPSASGTACLSRRPERTP